MRRPVVPRDTFIAAAAVYAAMAGSDTGGVTATVEVRARTGRGAASQRRAAGHQRDRVGAARGAAKATAPGLHKAWISGGRGINAQLARQLTLQ